MAIYDRLNNNLIYSLALSNIMVWSFFISWKCCVVYSLHKVQLSIPTITNIIDFCWGYTQTHAHAHKESRCFNLPPTHFHVNSRKAISGLLSFCGCYWNNPWTRAVPPRGQEFRAKTCNLNHSSLTCFQKSITKHWHDQSQGLNVNDDGQKHPQARDLQQGHIMGIN